MLHATRAVGPVAAGFIVESVGEGACFAFNAATFLFLIAALMMIDRKRMLAAPPLRSPMAASIREGLSFARRDRQMRMGLVNTAIVSIIGMPYLAILPVFADRVYGGGAAELGLMMGSSGGGALLGALWMAGRRSSEGLLNLSAAATALFGMSLVAFSAMPTLPLGMAMLAVCAFFTTIHFSSVHTLTQQRSPDGLRGRAMSLFTTIAMGAAPPGILAAGIAARYAGAPATAAAIGSLCLAGGAAIWIRARSASPSG